MTDALDPVYPSTGVKSSPDRGQAGRLKEVILGYKTGAMQDPVYELPRTLISPTQVNTGKKKAGQPVSNTPRLLSWDRGGYELTD